MAKLLVYCRKSTLILLFSLLCLLCVVVVLGGAWAFGAAETYNLTVRCAQGDVQNTYKICKISDEHGNFDNTFFDWNQYKIDHPDTEGKTEEQILRDLREQLNDYKNKDIGYLARLTKNTDFCPVVTSDSVDPIPVSLSAGSYILVSDTACPLIVGLDDSSDINVEIAEKTAGPNINLTIKDFKGNFVSEAILSQDSNIEFNGQIKLPDTVDQFEQYPITCYLTYDVSELKLQDNIKVILSDGTDITNKFSIIKEDGKIKLVYFEGALKSSNISAQDVFNIKCNFEVGKTAKPGNKGPKIAGTVDYPASPTNTSTTKTTKSVFAKIALMKLGVFVCNKESGSPYQGINFLISNDKNEYFNTGDETWTSIDKATTFKTDASGYINIDKAIGAGTYNLLQINDAPDGNIAASTETKILLSGEFSLGDLIINATAQGAGTIADIDSVTGQVNVKIELAKEASWIPQTIDKNILIALAVITLLFFSCLIYIQRKKVMKKRG